MTYEQAFVDELCKIAAMDKISKSLLAANNKKYWQMLKRVHGGTEAAVADLSKTPNSQRGIYHGTWGENVPEILNTGLRPGHSHLQGRGVYMGNFERASEYGQPIRSAEHTRGIELNKNVPRHMVKLKAPHQLQPGQTYPRINDVFRHAPDTTMTRDFDIAAASNNANRFMAYGHVSAPSFRTQYKQIVLRSNVSPHLLQAVA